MRQGVLGWIFSSYFFFFHEKTTTTTAAAGVLILFYFLELAKWAFFMVIFFKHILIVFTVRLGFIFNNDESPFMKKKVFETQLLNYYE